jgi:hypothetical protein
VIGKDTKCAEERKLTKNSEKVVNFQMKLPQIVGKVEKLRENLGKLRRKLEKLGKLEKI